MSSVRSRCPARWSAGRASRFPLAWRRQSPGIFRPARRQRSHTRSARSRFGGRDRSRTARPWANLTDDRTPEYCRPRGSAHNSARKLLCTHATGTQFGANDPQRSHPMPRVPTTNPTGSVGVRGSSPLSSTSISGGCRRPTYRAGRQWAPVWAPIRFTVRPWRAPRRPEGQPRHDSEASGRQGSAYAPHRGGLCERRRARDVRPRLRGRFGQGHERRSVRLGQPPIAAPGQLGRILITRDSTTTRTPREMIDCSAIRPFAFRVSGSVSVGLKATTLVNAR
jgi:hypothetical protein